MKEKTLVGKIGKLLRDKGYNKGTIKILAEEANCPEQKIKEMRDLHFLKGKELNKILEE